MSLQRHVASGFWTLQTAAEAQVGGTPFALIAHLAGCLLLEDNLVDSIQGVDYGRGSVEVPASAS